jgi:ribonucleotide monophosphatase NagD (HAD superfamily)
MIQLEQIINPTIAAIGQVLDKEFKKPTRIMVSSEGGHLEDILRFPWIRVVNKEPIDAILFGANRLLTYFELNYIYRLFKKGIPLIVLGGEYSAEGKIFGDQGEFLVEGAFAKVLELATGREAKYIGKPCKEMFLQALETLKLSEKNVIMIGDTFERDIIGAVKLGIDSIWLNRRNENIRKYLDKLEEQAKSNVCVYAMNSLELDKEVERIY